MAKIQCEQCIKIPLPLLKKVGLLTPGLKAQTFFWRPDVGDDSNLAVISKINNQDSFIEVLFRTKNVATGEVSPPIAIRLQLTSTPCFFGGKRYWLKCPIKQNGQACNRRIAMAYMREQEVGCRKCLKLSYKSQMESTGYTFWALDRYLNTLKRVHNKLQARRTKTYLGNPTRYLIKWIVKTKYLHVLSEEALRVMDILKHKQALQDKKKLPIK